MTLADFASTKTSDYTPGPGQYNINNYTSVGNRYSLRYSIRPKYREKKSLTSDIDYPSERQGLTPQDKTIGPIIGKRDLGNSQNRNTGDIGPEYLPNPTEFLSKSVKIRSKYDDVNQKMKDIENPGPGQYSPIYYDELKKVVIPPISARGEIQLSANNDSPGPANYSVPRNQIESPRYTIRPKTDGEFDISRSNPGPGYKYNNPRISGSDSPRWQFPKGGAAKIRENGVPGPGFYDQENEPSRKLGTKIRPKYKEKRAEYSNVTIQNLREIDDQIPNYSKIQIGNKFDSGFYANRNKNPGPNFVPTDTNIADKSKTRLKTKIRNRFDDPEHPSPYPNYTYTYTKDGKCVRQPAQRGGSMHYSNPGPSDYYPKDPSKRSYPEFSMKGPMDRADWLPKDLGNPGPGQYNIKSENNLPKWSIGNKSRYFDYYDDEDPNNRRPNTSRNIRRRRMDQNSEEREPQSARRKRNRESVKRNKDNDSNIRKRTDFE